MGGVSYRRFQTLFPYHMDAEDLEGRRRFLSFTVYTSGALFAATAAIAALGRARTSRVRRVHRALPIVAASELARGEAHYFCYPEPDDQAMLIHLRHGGFVAYSQRCTHLSCAVVHQPELARLYCPCHEGVFSPETGAPLAGPPQRPLPRIDLDLRDGVLYATGVRP